MSFPLNPINNQQVIVNGIKYAYSSATNSWRRDFNNVLDRLFLQGNYQAVPGTTSTGDLVVTGGGNFGKNLVIGGDLYVNGTGTTFVNTITGTVTTASGAISLIGGARGSLVYQSDTSTSAFIAIQSTGSILMSNGLIPIWTATAAINVAYANTATNLRGSTYQVPYQSSTGTTAFSSNFTFNGTTVGVNTSTESLGTASGALVVAGGVGIGGDLYVGGNLQINGTATYITSVTLEVTDKNIVIAKGAINAGAADGAGITVDTANATFTYSSSFDTWNMNKPLVLSSSTQAFSTVSGALRVAGGVGVGGNIYAGAVFAPITGTIGAGTKNTGAFTTVTVTSASASSSTSTGALTVAGGMGIAGDLYVGGTINGSVTSANFATTASFAVTAGVATTATTAQSALTAISATTATNIAGGTANRIPFQSGVGQTTYSSSLTFDGTLFETSKIQVTQSNSSTLPTAVSGLDLQNSGINQSPTIRLAGSTTGIVMLSSFGTLRIMQDASPLTNTLLSVGLTSVNIPLGTASINTGSGSLVVAGGVGLSGNLNAGGTIYQNGAAVATMSSVPTSSTSTGIVGQMASDGTFAYLCYATNTWRRWAVSTF